VRKGSPAGITPRPSTARITTRWRLLGNS